MLLREPLLSKLRELGNIPWKRLDELLKESESDCSRFCEIACRDRFFEQDAAGQVIADSLGFAYLNLTRTLLDQRLLARLPRETALKYQVLPIYKLGTAVTVAMYNPGDTAVVGLLERLFECKIDPNFSFAAEIKATIKANYRATDALAADGVDLDNFANLEPSQLVELRPIVNLSNAILLSALREGASDIHFEPKESWAVVRFRTDGLMSIRARIPGPLVRALTARYKILANLNITESRVPQDGRISFRTDEKKIDVRVSTLPVIHGEKIVMRLLGSLKGDVKLNLDKLSISEDILAAIKKMLDEPNGIIFVTGPTGSGKSTTLYASLSYADSPESNLTTIEDPIEYEIPTLNQSAVDVKAGRTFQAILRSILRQDPDVVLVGEIRDAETARIATQAALTGHLVLSSLHTNNSLQAMTRLLDMGVEPYVVAPAVLGVIGQRLVRRLCPHCKEAFTPSAEIMAEYCNWEGEFPNPRLFKPRGCAQCKGLGYRGRLGIHEIFQVTPEVRDLILHGRGYNDIRNLAYASGFKDMRYDGFCKVFQGHTSLEEVVRVTATES